jgi:hypothetical protein
LSVCPGLVGVGIEHLARTFAQSQDTSQWLFFNPSNPHRHSEKACLFRGTPVHLADISLDTGGSAWYAVEASQNGGFTKQNRPKQLSRGSATGLNRFVKCCRWGKRGQRHDHGARLRRPGGVFPRLWPGAKAGRSENCPACAWNHCPFPFSRNYSAPAWPATSGSISITIDHRANFVNLSITPPCCAITGAAAAGPAES